MSIDAPNGARSVHLFPPIAAALDRWRRGDEAFSRATSRNERGIAMLEQVRARGVIHRLSEIELLLERPLRVLLVEEEVWSPDEALDRLVVADFCVRAHRLSDLGPVLRDACLDRALDMATRHGWGDDTRWEVDEELVQSLSARKVALAKQDEHRSEDTPVAESGPRDSRPVLMAMATRDTLASVLFRDRASGQDMWDEPWFGRMLSYVQNDNLWPEHLALAAELGRDRTDPRSAEIRRALLTSGHKLWAEPWFRSVLDATERRGYLKRLIAQHEDTKVAWDDRFRGLLQIAERLQGAPRATVLRWAVAVREQRSKWEMTTDLARAAELANGHQRAAIVRKIESEVEKLDADEQIAVFVRLMAGATRAETIELARRGFRTIAGGATTIQDAIVFLTAIPAVAWTDLGRTEWEPALGAGGGGNSGWATHLRWVPYDPALLSVPNLPEEARRLIEERGLPVLLGQDADDRLRVAAMSIQALSPAGRAQLTASVLALDVATWREAGGAVGPIARALDDSELERLSGIFHEPDPRDKWWGEKGLAEAWAARGRLDRATAIVDRITDDDERAAAQVAVAVVAEEIAALRAPLDARVVRRAVFFRTKALLPTSLPQQGHAFADALATRLDDGSSASACLEVWAALWPALSDARRGELAPRIERAVETVLTGDNLEDDSLCAICEVLPERLLERIWIVRASSTAYRHALSSLYDNRFCEFMLAGDHRHPCVLHIVQTLGGDEALLEHARWLAGVGADSGENSVGAHDTGA